jgi:CheY-like chemotaxis protein
MSPKQIAAGWKLLIVDNEPDNLDLAERMLSFYGAEVRTARHGLEALVVLRAFTPDVVLLDLAMPVMDGWQTFAEMRTHPLMAQIPVIAVTAQVEDNEEERAREVGFTGFIAKPFRLDTLLAEIGRCIKHDPATTST